MASNINYISIDETFPIAGRDNDSQGFRDNYAIIKNNFEAAKSEIEDLQLNTARIDDSNNFNTNTLSNMNLSYYTEEVSGGDGTVINTLTLLNYEDGVYHSYIVEVPAPGGYPSTLNEIRFTLTGFPSGGNIARMYLDLRTNNSLFTKIRFQVNGGVSVKKGPKFRELEAADPNGVITPNNSTDHMIFEFWSYSGASTVFVEFVGRFNESPFAS